MFGKKKKATATITEDFSGRTATTTDMPLGHLIHDLHEVLADIRDDLRVIRDHLEDEEKVTDIAVDIAAVRENLETLTDSTIGDRE